MEKKPICIFFAFLVLLYLTDVIAQSHTPNRSLDTLLQGYAYQAFDKPHTGVIYVASVPANLSGLQLSVIRLRSGSLRTRGVPKFFEIGIPAGVVVKPYVERLALVYQNLGNWSSVYYNVPGYTFVAPVLGLLAYDASNISATGLSELDLMVTKNPISIDFGEIMAPMGSIGKCVWFSLNGSHVLSDLIGSSSCSTSNQGHFSVVVESIAPAPSPVPVIGIPPAAPAPPTPNIGPPPGGYEGKGGSNVWKIVTGSVVGGFVVLVLLGLLVFFLMKYRKNRKLVEMERQADLGESLQTASIGTYRTPAAMGTRTQPILENDYAA